MTTPINTPGLEQGHELALHALQITDDQKQWKWWTGHYHQDGEPSLTDNPNTALWASETAVFEEELRNIDEGSARLIEVITAIKHTALCET